MTDDGDPTDLDGYLRANRDAFTRDALTRRLVDSGYDPAAVETAWSRVEQSGSVPANAPGLAPASGPAQAPGSPIAPLPAGPPASQWVTNIESPVARAVPRRGAGTTLMAVTIFVVYGAAIGAAALAVSFGGAISILMIVYVGTMLGGLYLSLRRLLRAPATGGRSAIWIAFGLSTLIFVGLSGACLAGLGPASSQGGGLFGHAPQP